MNETTEFGMIVKRGPGRPPKQERPILSINPPIYTKDRLDHWAYRLALAAAMRAGVMDSESRHVEVQMQKDAIMQAIAAEMRAL